MDKLLHRFVLQLADNELIIGHRLSEWCGHGPALEQDIALANIALDHVGQARMFYQVAANMEGGEKTEDDYAYRRDVTSFYNLQLLEYENVDFAYTVARSFFYDQFYFLLLEQLIQSDQKELANIAASAIKEVKYHIRYSSEWMKRLGDGTEVSHNKIQQAINDLFPYTGEMFKPSSADQYMLEKYGIHTAELKDRWRKEVAEIMNQATLSFPEDGWSHEEGKNGIHTEKMGFILAELQFVQRAYPNMEW